MRSYSVVSFVAWSFREASDLNGLRYSCMDAVSALQTDPDMLRLGIITVVRLEIPNEGPQFGAFAQDRLQVAVNHGFLLSGNGAQREIADARSHAAMLYHSAEAI